MVHTSAMATGVAIIGMMNNPRRKPRSGNFWWNTTAANVPNTSGSSTDKKVYAPAEDPGVQSVRRIYDWFKLHGYPTIVMGASFRNIGQIQALAGCDRLTISPDLLQKLEETQDDLPRVLSDNGKREERQSRISEAAFRWGHNENAMATDKLAEGIRKFAVDQRKLEELLGAKL